MDGRIRSPRKKFSVIEKNNGCFELSSHFAKSPSGYPQIRFNGKTYIFSRIVYSEIKGVIPKGMIIRHSCDNRCCIAPSHLLLGTHKDNSRDAKERGRYCHGETIGNSKLKGEQVIEIFNSKEKRRALALRYNVSKTTIAHIKLGNCWQHLTKKVHVPKNKKSLLTSLNHK